MTAYLLDVNVLVALWWPGHTAHKAAQEWFARRHKHGWASTPMTQAGFVRIVSNSAFSPDAVSVGDALGLLEANVSHRSHQFWPDSLPLASALEALAAPLRGHRQVNDAYLLGLAIRKQGVLVTLDRGLAALAGERTATTRAVECIGAQA